MSPSGETRNFSKFQRITGVALTVGDLELGVDQVAVVAVDLDLLHEGKVTP